MPMSEAEMKDFVKKVRLKIRVTKVVCTRSVKGRNGDAFAGFSAAWNSTQEDGGQDLVEAGDPGDQVRSMGNMTLQEAVIASHIMAREADIAAYQHALAGGTISKEFASDAIRSAKASYSSLIISALQGSENNGNGSTPPVAAPEPVPSKDPTGNQG